MSVKLSNPHSPKGIDTSDILLHKGGMKVRGLKFIFTSKLVTSNDKSVGMLDRILFFHQLKKKGAKDAKGIIRELKLEKSGNAELRKLAEETLDNIRENKAASRKDFDRLMLMKSLDSVLASKPQSGTRSVGNSPAPENEQMVMNRSGMHIDESLVSRGRLDSYADTHALAGLRSLMSAAGGPPETSATLMSYIRSPEKMMEKCHQGRSADGIDHKSKLTVAVAWLTTTVAGLKNDDPLKPALDKLASQIKSQMP